MNIGTIIKNERIKRGISRRELSVLSGVHENTITNIERNHTDTTLKTAVMILKVLGFKLAVVRK